MTLSILFILLLTASFLSIYSHGFEMGINRSSSPAVTTTYHANVLDTIILKEVGFKYLMNTLPQIVANNKVTIHPLTFAKVKVSCALSINYQHCLPANNRAIDEYISDQSLSMPNIGYPYAFSTS